MHVHGRTDGSITQLAARLTDCEISLRWGGNRVAGAINGEVKLLNGLEQLQIFKEKGVPCPEFLLPNTPITLPIEGGVVWLARKAEHTQGRDILVVGGPRERGRRRWPNSDFFVKYIPDVVGEWRFHILKGESIARGQKFWAGNGPEPTVVPTIRSRRNNWHIRHDSKPPKGLRALAKKAVEAVGYDLGAVDILQLADGSGVVLEVNSRPAIRDEYTLGQYEKAFRKLATL